MNTKRITLMIMFSLFVSSVAFADRPLDGIEILQIFRQLTNQPKKTWIPAGTIEATHEEYRAPTTTDLPEVNQQINEKIQEYQTNLNKRELTENLQKMKLDAIPFNVRYKLSNEYTTKSTMLVRFDGDRFYWEINIDSRTDSVKPGADLEGNFMTDQFDLNWNAKRISAWDGEKYATYVLPSNHAIVDSTGRTPHVVSGPLTAGFIPWGYGRYTYENLCAIESSAIEEYTDGKKQIYLTLNNPDGSEILFVLDPQKDYAVTSCSVSGSGNSTTLKEYSGYKLVAGNWVPTAIFVERYDGAANRLLASHFWNFTKISGDVPGIERFSVEYDPDALIEYRSVVTDKPLMYRYSHIVNTDLLLAERLAIAASEGIRAQNCATIAMEYALSRLGKDVTDQQLAQLIGEQNGNTNLYAMKQFAEGLGLYCRAVKTDIQTLKSLDGSQVILHIPGKNHFVVLAYIDSEYVWTIDLANNRFFYHIDLNFFDMDWTEGTALLISNQPVRIQGNFTEIDDSQLRNTIGGSGYTCTRLLQEYNVDFCSYTGGECWGYYEEYYERWGCKAAESGSCTNSAMLRMKESPCINDPYNFYACDITGEWTFYYMRACK